MWGGAFLAQAITFLNAAQRHIHLESWKFVTFSFLLYLKLVNLFGKNFPGGGSCYIFFTRCPANFLIKKYKKIAVSPNKTFTALFSLMPPVLARVDAIQLFFDIVSPHGNVL